MEGRLVPGTTVHLRHHRLECVVDELLGAGGQGEVYRVLVQDKGRVQPMALKWYFREWATPQQWRDLNWLTEQEPPGVGFLWPFDLVVAPDRDEFGYVMPLRPDRYHGCTTIVSGRLDISFSSLLKACMWLADGFGSLHARGLCYRDISFGNIFIDPGSGGVLIADNDNVAIDGEGSPGVRGTDRFMAPEIVRGAAVPSVSTDLYSLSVLLFYLLTVSHPLEGARLSGGDVFSREDAIDLYGRNPLFIFDPDDRSNAPDPDRHQNAGIYWALYPQMLRNLFLRAFTVGLHDPVAGRVREGEWRDCMARLIDLLVPCICGASVFIEPDGQDTAPCWSCGRATLDNARLPRLILDPDIERRVVALNMGRRLFDHHVGGRRYDYRSVTGQVVRHPRLADVVGLRNLSPLTWTSRVNDGSELPVPPGRTITIAPGTRIRFGPLEGVVDW